MNVWLLLGLVLGEFDLLFVGLAFVDDESGLREVVVLVLAEVAIGVVDVAVSLLKPRPSASENNSPSEKRNGMLANEGRKRQNDEHQRLKDASRQDLGNTKRRTIKRDDEAAIDGITETAFKPSHTTPKSTRTYSASKLGANKSSPPKSSEESMVNVRDWFCCW